MKKPLLIFIVLCLFSSCRTDHSVAPNKWEAVGMNYVELKKFTEVIEEEKNVKLNPTLNFFVEGDFLNMLSDSTFTRLSFGSHFSFGKWRIDTSQSNITLLSKFGLNSKIYDTVIFKIAKLNSTELVLHNADRPQASDNPSLGVEMKSKDSNGLGLETELIFKKDSKVQKPDEDYSSLKNNLWRIRPDSNETLDQIRTRVKSSFRFAILFLSSYQNKKKNSVPLRPLVLPLNIASNGVQLKKSNNIDKWNNIFYDEQDAQAGYQIIKEAMSKNITMPEDRGVDLIINLLEQIAKSI